MYASFVTPCCFFHRPNPQFKSTRYLPFAANYGAFYACLMITVFFSLNKRNQKWLEVPPHYENMPMQYTKIFIGVKNENFQQKKFDIFLIFAQNIDCGYTLEPPRRGGSNEYPQSTYFGAKIRKIGIPLRTPVLLYKGGVQGGIYITDMFS